MPAPSTLTDKVKLFCREYIIDRNGARAAIAAGYAPNSAKVTASRMLSQDHVKAYVEELLAPRIEKLEITADRIMDELARMAFGDPELMLGLKYSDKVKACAELADIKKLYPDKNVNVKADVTNRVVGMAEILEEINGADTGVGSSSAPSA